MEKVSTKRIRFWGAVSLLLAGLLVFSGCGREGAGKRARPASPGAEVSRVSGGAQGSKASSPQAGGTSSSQAKNASSSPAATGDDIAGISFLSAREGFLTLGTYKAGEGVLERSVLFRTEDGGVHWAAVGENRLEQIRFCDAETGYGLAPNAGGSGSALMRTRDGGKSWRSVSLPAGGNAAGFQALSPRLLFAAVSAAAGGSPANTFRLFRSEDGGASWAEIALPPAKLDFTFSFDWLSARKGYALFGGEGFTQSQFKTLYYTSDGGKSWSVRSATGQPETGTGEYAGKVGDLPLIGYGGGTRFFENGAGYFFTRAWGLCRTADGGVRFTGVGEPGAVIFCAGPDFIDETEGFAAVKRPSEEAEWLCRTADGGASWVPLEPVSAFAPLAGKAGGR